MALRKKQSNLRNQVDQTLFLRVHFLRNIFVAVLLGVSFLASAQDQPRRGSKIIDDTTKQVYGPKTSRYYFEKDVFLNQQTYHYIDTVIRGFHRFNYVQRNLNFYQDLGNIGTALNPIYYHVPDVIGVSSGFTAYDLIWNTEQIRQYDTKSPYSNMNVILGGKGRSITKAAYARNINPRWNFGFNYRGLFIDKQVQRQGKGDRNVRSNYYDLFTAFQSKDSTYRLFFNFQRNMQEADEYGGIRHDSEIPYQDFFEKDAPPSLTNAVSKELRINVHLFHQYEIGKALQVYHIFDRYRQGNQFLDAPESNPVTDYYDFVEVDSLKTTDQVKFKFVRNEVGIKGNLAKLFYNGYYAIRDYSMTYHYIDEDTLSNPSGTESYLGGRISLRLDSIGEVTGWAEVLQTGNYRLEGHIKSKWFEASLKQVQYAPSFLQQAYRGSHDVWENNFSDINVTQINGYIHYNSKVLSLSPGVTFTRIGNYVFFKEDPAAVGQKVLPVQTSGEQVIVSPELRLSVTMAKHIFLRGQAVYTTLLKNTDEAIQVPSLFVNGELSYENIFFNDNMDMHAGVDVHWKSTYYAPGYDVPIQQFYIQQSYKVPDFPVIDLFFSTRIKRARIFVKYNNVLQAFTKQGYMPTPYYIGQRNVLDFGFDWSFYD